MGLEIWKDEPSDSSALSEDRKNIAQEEEGCEDNAP